MTAADPASFGPVPELAWLPVAKLSVDGRYQRSLDTRAGQRLIERLVENFRWSAFQAILACPDGKGGWLIIDGQHRAEAARRLGIEHVPAVVVAAGSVAEQARAFILANDQRVTVNQYAKHHARLAAGDPAAQEIDRRAAKAGMTIPHYPIPADNLKPGQTLALASFVSLPKRYGDVVADLAFKAVADAYRGQPGGLRAAFFAGMAEWLANAAGAEERRRKADSAAAALGGRPWAELDNRALARRHQRGGSVIANVSAIIALWANAPSVDRARLMAGR